MLAVDSTLNIYIQANLSKISKLLKYADFRYDFVILYVAPSIVVRYQEVTLTRCYSRCLVSRTRRNVLG